MLHDIQTGNLLVHNTLFDYSANNVMLFCITAATLAMTTILFRKVRGLSAALALLQQPTTTHAAAITPPHLLDFFIHDNPTTTTPITMIQWEPTITTTDMLWLFIVILTILSLLYKWHTKRHHSFVMAKLYLEIGNKQDQTIIPLMTLCHPTKYYAFTFEDAFQTLTVSGHITPKLHTQCNNFTAYDSMTQLTHTIPQTIPLGPIQANTTRKILRGQYYSTIYTFENGNFTPILARNDSHTSISIDTQT